MDEAGSFMARIQSSIVVPIMYRMVHTGKLPKFMQKKINEADKSKKELSKIRISENITCSMKNCIAAIVQNGWKK